uniref:UDP-glucose ceramide glucosyltransferase-like 1 n=1 Tax=Scleropages formosus TaxID=113540 RepID=A0A8D0C769_SCLFO
MAAATVTGPIAVRRSALLVLALALTLHRAHAAAKGVSASLNAKWPATPFLLETSEFIAEDGNEKFWQFVDTVKELTVYKNGESVRSYYNLIIKKAAQFVSDLQVSLLKFALSLRSYSPTVHAFQQIASNEPPPEGCSAFVVIHGHHACSTKDVKKLLKTALDRPRPYLYKSDHKYPGANSTDVPVAILYAEIGTKKFNTLHKVLSEKADEGKLTYVLRHFETKPEKLRLSGYAVELAIKSTEYKAVDDTRVKGTNAENRQEKLLFSHRKSYPELQDHLIDLQKHLLESSNDMAPLKVWEMQDLSFQAASRIMSASKFDSLKLMRDVSQNFPIKARSLTRVVVNHEMRKEIEGNQKVLSETLGIHPGEAGLFINGLHIDLDVHTPFSILDTIKGEGKILEGLHNLGIKGEEQAKFLRLPVHPIEESYALDIRNPAIMWVNDIEMDHMYRSWPSSSQELLRTTFPGVIRQIRRNFFNLVLFLDPCHEDSGELVKLAELFYSHTIPLRIGFVFVVNMDDRVDGTIDAGVGFVRVLNYVTEEYDFAQAFASMVSIYKKVEEGQVLSAGDVASYLKKKFPKASVAKILGPDSIYDDKRKVEPAFYRKTGLGSLPVALFNGVPLSSEEMDPEELETVLLQRIMDSTSFFQRAVFMVGFLDLSATLSSTKRDQSQAVILTGFYVFLVVDDWKDPNTFSYLDSRDQSAVIATRVKYISKSGEQYCLCPFLSHSKLNPPSKPSSAGIYVGVLPESLTEVNTVITRAIWASLHTQRSKETFSFLQKILKEENTKQLDQGAKMRDFLVDTFEKKYNTIGVEFLHSQRLFCQNVLKLTSGQQAVVINGRILGPFEEEFELEDFHLLEKITLSASAEKIKGMVKSMGLMAKHSWVSPIHGLILGCSHSCVCFTVLLIVRSDSCDSPLSALPSVLHLSPRPDEVFYDVVAVVDPLTREAQKMSSLLIVLSQVINMKLQVFMNCRAKLSEMPLKSFYRFVLESDVMFLANDTVSPGPLARFTEMPESPLLTLNMITPESWMVEAVRSSYDLDNIHLQEVSVVMAEYELEYLLLEGHCFDQSTGQPPRGLQFTLGMTRDPLMQDTIVMANLGYFQLKANPGAWILKLRKGRSEEIYQILAHDGTDSPADADAGDVIVVLNSFHSKIIKVRVCGKPVALFSISCSITGQPTSEEAEKKEDVLNIFSVASGHLYERFLRIMMLSVLRHTKTPVKFWFLKNYLSPSFKESIPHLAEAYGFQYELVQYKWPRWLHQQTEKQRIIWGYKILFLDVLFPLAVDKIIFVDADQIVRADLKDLRDLDLQGAPYGYTPFCDSRKEMEGYRFWKSGYWASHLGNRKYHISALYVVDLKKFRKIAAGDRLRGQYQALSQDPNSLSNLDQDLPNNMIHQVAIKSLPQEWLWCETWCDDASKAAAKTIDLCNNPKTKEPKLAAAVRIVPEWAEYDHKIKELLKKNSGKPQSRTEAPQGRGGQDNLGNAPCRIALGLIGFGWINGID